MAKIFGDVASLMLNNTENNPPTHLNIQTDWSLEKLLYHFKKDYSFISQKAKKNLERNIKK